jgi:branched-subunit amino acid aminotransferase/4-amino-4-deoxychorismate lyase
VDLFPLLLVEVDGIEPTAAELATLAFASYGHFTAMQVRGGRVRGLAHHLDRLTAANRELFEADLDGDRLRELIRHALDGVADASVRVVMHGNLPGGRVSTVVTVRPPATPSATVALLPVDYHRTVAHIKRPNDFGQAYYGRQAVRQGFDDALLTTPDQVVTEAAIANVGFFDGSSVVWPDAPMLRGITLQVVESRLAELPARHQVVRLEQVPGFAAAFVTNSQGIAAVTRIGEHEFAVDERLMAALHSAYDTAPADLI